MLRNYCTIYTECLHNKSLHYETYELIWHNIWFHFNTKHGHMFLFFCIHVVHFFFHLLSVGITYSVVLPHTSCQHNISSHNSCEHINRSQGTCDCDWVKSPLKRINLHPHTKQCLSRLWLRYSLAMRLCRTMKQLSWKQITDQLTKRTETQTRRNHDIENKIKSPCEWIPEESCFVKLTIFLTQSREGKKIEGKKALSLEVASFRAGCQMSDRSGAGPLWLST